MAANSTPLQLFIDTNVLLNFYDFNKDDLEELRKVIGLVKKGSLKLFMPQQLLKEFLRHRETRLSRSIQTFGTAHLQRAVPRYMATYPEAKAYDKAVNELDKLRNLLVAKAKADAETKTLAADELFADIVGATKILIPEADLIARATKRMTLGDPPGKPQELGDRINWELLLVHAEQGDLHLISNDGDYQSPLAARPHQYLGEEWAEKKKGKLFLYTELTPFFTQHFSNIKLAIDIEKHEFIEALVNSGHFAATHAAIAKLSPYSDVLTLDDVVKLAEAACENSQIGWIASDTDVHEFYSKILKQFGAKLPEPLKANVHALFNPPAAGAIDEIPF
jgi:hypothetical protein